MTTGTSQDQARTLPDGLTELDAAMLDLERSWWKYPAAKDGAIRERFELSPTQYYAALNRLLDAPAGALAYDVLTTKRLLNLRERRRQQRDARRARDGAESGAASHHDWS